MVIISCNVSSLSILTGGTGTYNEVLYIPSGNITSASKAAFCAVVQADGASPTILLTLTSIIPKKNGKYFANLNNNCQYQKHKLLDTKMFIIWNLNFYDLEFI